MNWSRLSISTVLLFVAVVFSTSAFAQKDKIEGVWLNEEGTGKVKIYKAKNGKFYGKIVWLKEPLRNGKPKLDEENPDEEMRKKQILGLLILKGFEKEEDEENEYEEGTIYDPKNGKTYSCVITHNGDKLDVAGYVGFSWIGRTTVWTRTTHEE